MALAETSMKGEAFLGWSLGPVFCFLVAIFLGPFFYMVWLSITDLSFAVVGRDGNLIGFANYA